MGIRSTRVIYVSVGSLGRFSLMGGGSLFLPCALRLLPFRRRALPRFSLAPAAHARPCALTLCPPGFALLCGHARPATLPICAGNPPHLWAPLRSAHATHTGVRLLSNGRTSRMTSCVKHTRFRKAHTENKKIKFGYETLIR